MLYDIPKRRGLKNEYILSDLKSRALGYWFKIVRFKNWKDKHLDTSFKHFTKTLSKLSL